MSNPYAPSLLDQPTAPLPLTDRSAKYLRNTVSQIEGEIARMEEAEQYYEKEAASCRALHDLLTATRDQYVRDLGDHATPPATLARWKVDPQIATRQVEEPCPPCGQPMLWTETIGYVHEVDGWWVVAGEWCVQAAQAQDGTQVLPAVDIEPVS